MARERLLNGKEIKIVYDDPWFWKVSAYREVKKDNHHSDREERPRASIRFDDDREQVQRPRERPREQAVRRQDRPRDDSRDRHQDRHQDRRQDRRQDRPHINEKSKEFLDKELEKINPTIPQSMRVAIPEPPPKTVVKTEYVGSGAVVYDMDVVNSTKRRKIVIKKDPVVQKAPLKIEAEEGEVSDEDHGDGADGDGLANVSW
jgi:hypothetical protein